MKRMGIVVAAFALVLALAGCAASSSSSSAASASGSGASASSSASGAAASATSASAKTASPSAAASEKESGQNPVMNFVGVYADGRATMTVAASGSNEALITVDWGSSAAERAEWVMKGTFNTENLKVEYSGGTKSVTVFKEDGTVESETVEYTDGTGVITFADNPLSVTWQDDKEHIADDLTFTWAVA